MPDIPLTSLCAVCYTNPPIYTCPRCATHTCSLTCVLKHKKQAPCSGVRNPAEYRKLSELKTASSVDRDFNFITSIERNLGKAAEERQGRKIHVVPTSLRLGGGEQAAETKGKLENIMEERKIKWERCPRGLSRREENKTKVVRRGEVMWTVEWILGQERRLRNCAEERTLGEWFVELFGKKGKKVPRARWKKRKREEEGDKHGEDREEQQEDPLPGITEEGRPSATAEHAAVEARIPTDGLPQSGEQQSNDGHDSGQAANAKAESTSEHSDGVPENYHFYLHRPRTAPKVKVLVPVSKGSTLREVLMSRTILEYPTIYIREEPPDELSRPFMLEATYLEQHGEDVAVPTATAATEDELEEGEVADLASVPLDDLLAQVDSASVLNALKSDVTL